MTQVELDFAPKPIEGQNKLEAILHANGGWLTSRNIKTLYGLDPRECRHCSEHSESIISGNLGYRHMDHATTVECDEYFRRKQSQMRAERISLARKMRRYHRRTA